MKQLPEIAWCRLAHRHRYALPPGLGQAEMLARQAMTETPPDQAACPALHGIDVRLAEIGVELAVIREQLKAIRDHEERIRILEASRAKLVGAALAGSAIISMLGTWIGIAVTHH